MTLNEIVKKIKENDSSTEFQQFKSSMTWTSTPAHLKQTALSISTAPPTLKRLTTMENSITSYPT